MYGGVSDIKAAVIRPVIAIAACHALQIGDCLGRRLHGIHTLRRISRMTGQAAHPAAVANLALMRDHRSHQRRLTDNTGLRPYAGGIQILDQAAHADTTDFLVIRQRQMQRLP